MASFFGLCSRVSLSGALLTARTQSEKLQLVRDRLKSIPRRDSGLERFWKAFFNFDDSIALRANQMVVVPVVTFAEQLESSPPMAEVKPLHHPHFLQQVHRAIHGGQIAISLRQGPENVPDTGRVGVAAENLQDGLARASDVARFAPEPLGEIRKGARAMATDFHGLRGSKDFLRISRPKGREIKKSAMDVSTMAGPQGTSS